MIPDRLTVVVLLVLFAVAIVALIVNGGKP
jgi:hypothetical protein